MFNAVMVAHEEDTPIGEAAKRVVGDRDVGGRHARIMVAEENAEVQTQPVGGGGSGVFAGVACDLAIVEAVEINALAIDGSEVVVRVGSVIDIAGGVECD